ncbi:ubiquinol-cytochrome C chaperone family protein [Sphingomonas sp. 28-62-11]|uniref:ubiquinol-cytochrome C chaperone family protein n=1 Tax=Sphingomonas sp. 28-62-11 TaxID=1970432 RepID=UPI0035A8EA93
MGLIDRIFGEKQPPATAPLYDAIIAEGRAEHWYIDGAVPDTMDGRFDMIAAILAFVLLRLETDSTAAEPSARLTEQFITDMDNQLRQSGVGDVGIGKYVGQMMSMLGGRLGAYRDGLAAGDLLPAIKRNLYRGDDPGMAALDHSIGRLLALRDTLAALDTAAILRGQLR